LKTCRSLKNWNGILKKIPELKKLIFENHVKYEFQIEQVFENRIPKLKTCRSLKKNRNWI